jgi:hypothetical protein
MSVGDLVVIGEKVFYVDIIGFKVIGEEVV